MLSTIIQKHLNRISGEIGPRHSGTQGNRKAADYIEQVFTASTFAVERQEYACPGWEYTASELTLNGQTLEARANTYSPACNVAAPTVPLGTLAELEAAQLEGKVAVLYAELSEAPYSPKAWFLFSEREDRIITLLEQKCPAAIITVQAKRSGNLIRIFEDEQMRIPSATVPAHSGLALLRQPGGEVHLKIESTSFPAQSWNVVARKIAGGLAAANRAKVVLMAHYDTKIETPGACDNAAGVAALLATAQTLAQGEYPFDLEFVAFSSEEYLPLGDDEYVRRAGEESFGQVLAAINIDGIGQILSANSITLISGSEALQQRLNQITQQTPDFVWVEPWPESNHSTFSFRGVPSIAFTNKGGVPLEHLESNTLEWIDPARIESVVRLTQKIVGLLCGQSIAWARPASK